MATDRTGRDNDVPGVPDPATSDAAELVLARLVSGVLRAQHQQDFATGVCTAIHRHVDCFRVSLGQVDRRRGRFRASYWPPLPADHERRMLRVFGRHALQHPRLRAFLRGDRRRGVVSWADVDPTGRFTTTALYREFYAPDGITDQISLDLPAPPGLALGITVDRAGGRFDPAERRLLERLREVLEVVFGRADGSPVADVLGGLGWIPVVVDQDGVVQESSTAASVLGDRYGVALQVGESLVGTRWWTGLEPLIAGPQLLRGRRGPQITPVCVDEVEMVVESPALGHRTVHLAAEPAPFGGGALTSGRVLELLTPRQREVAEMLVAGLATNEIAHRLRLSPATARTHVEHIYERLGVHSRGSAVAVLLGRAAGRSFR